MRNNVALKYLESLDSVDSSPRFPLQPTSKYNSSPIKTTKFQDNQDLDKLAHEISKTSPIKRSTGVNQGLLRTKFESPSATVSLFKSPKTSNNNSLRSNADKLLPMSVPLETPTRPSGWLKTPLNVEGSTRLSPLKPSTSTTRSPGSPSSSGNGYEYLCRIQAIKNWLEVILQEEITQTPVELISYIRNGIHLAKLSNLILPSTRKVFMVDLKLQFKHTENINRFFQLLDYMNVPDLFRFELTDLYDAKNVPKVWFCLHALSYTISKSDPSLPVMGNLLNEIQFSDEDIKLANRALMGAGLPNFASADTQSNESSYFNAALSPHKLDIRPPSPSRPKVQVEKKEVETEKEAEKVEEIEEFFPPREAEEDNPFIEKEVSVSPAEISAPAPDHDTVLVPASLLDFTPISDSPLSGEVSNIIKVQALIRGSNYRYSMFVDRIMLRSFNDEFTDLFSVIRGNLSRLRSIHEHRTELLFFKSDIISLQSSARRKIGNKKLKSLRLQSHDSKEDNIQLQSILRGHQVRTRNYEIKDRLKNQLDSIVQFQTLVRRQNIYPKASVVIEHKSDVEEQILQLQSFARTCLFKRFKNTNAIKNSSTINKIIQLQSLIRGNVVKRDVTTKRIGIYKSLGEIYELQSISRGAIARTKLCNSVLITLIDEDSAFNELFAKVRGNSIRKQVQRKKRWIKHFEHDVFLPLQSTFRGILVRFENEMKIGDLYVDINNLIGLQSIIRGSHVRKQQQSIDQYYNNHISQVIKAQSIIKSNFVQRAYRGLINMKNPTLGVIKKFAYLLTDNDVDFQEEMTLGELKDQIIELAKSNEDIEQQIENLDIKLSLLDRNKISVEEFVRHKNKYKTYRPARSVSNSSNSPLAGPGSATAASPALEKSSRDRLDLYQKLFYLLQSNPQYLTRLNQIQSSSRDDNDRGALASLLSCLFPIKDSSIDHHCREEFLFVKFIFSMMQNDMEFNCKSISDITKPTKVLWIDYFLKMNNHTYQRQHLKNFMGKAAIGLIDDDIIDFESNPVEIYLAIRERELKTLGSSEKEGDRNSITPHVAIKDIEVSAKFVENLMQLREYATECLELLHRNIHRVPLHVKLISRHAYDLSKLQFPDKLESQHLAVAGVTFIKHYIGVILTNPENYGLSATSSYNSRSGELRAKDNLKHLNRVLIQAFSLKPFSDNFLKPLNEYLATCFTNITQSIKKLINVMDIETEYDMNQYDDVISHERPQLTIKVHDMMQISKLVRNNVEQLASNADDLIHVVVNKLDYLTDSSTKDIIAIAELGHVNLSLNPTTQEESVHDVKTKILFAQAKRSLLYIIRIQDGPGLLELLISGISSDHEAKFKRIVSEERSHNSMQDQLKRPYYKTSLGDLSKITYRDLKRMALEIILKLESDHQLTRKNSYQDLLNEIAIDIKTKHSQRISRKQQMDCAMESQRKLSQKSNFLRKQLSDYNRHVEHVLGQLQHKPKDKKLFLILPVFSKQYFYQRELRKSNRLPKFGSYKYSSKKLLEQGVIKDFAGSVGAKFASSSKLDFMFSCNEVGKFTIEAASGSGSIPGALNLITLDELLNLQYESKQTFELFDGMVTFETHNFMAFLFRKFYHTS